MTTISGFSFNSDDILYWFYTVALSNEFCSFSFLIPLIWLSPIIKIIVTSPKVPAYILVSCSTFGFCNNCCVWIYHSIMQIFCLLLMPLSKFAFFSSVSTVEIFIDQNWSLTYNGEYKFRSCGTLLCLLHEHLVFLLWRSIVESFLVSFLSLFWFFTLPEVFYFQAKQFWPAPPVIVFPL